MGRPLAVLISIVVALLAGGCTTLRDADMVKLCRSLIPLFNGASTRIDVRRAEATHSALGTMTTITYDAVSAGDVSVRRAVSCMVTRSERRPADLHLVAVATEDGPLGDIRLHFIREFWNRKGEAAVSDPAPIDLVGPVPELSRPVAVALQALIAGLPGLGIYALLAAAYALIYGLVGRINLAFGELAVMAGYGTFLGFTLFAANPVLAWPVLAGLALGLYTAAINGHVLGRLVFAPLIERPGQHILIATMGLSIAWSELVRLMQGSGTRWLAPFFAQPLGIARADNQIVTVTPMVLIVAATSALACAAGLAVLAWTRFGRRWRAVSDDPVAAELLGISMVRVVGETMLLACLLAGLAGVLTTLHYGGAGYAGGLVIGLKSLIAAVIGGIGSVSGALVGALVVGLGETAWSVLFPIEYRDLALFLALAAMLAFRPEGLLGRR